MSRELSKVECGNRLQMLVFKAIFTLIHESSNNHGKGADHSTQSRLLEDKNWAIGTHMTLKNFLNEVLQRKLDSDPNNKLPLIVIIPKLKVVNPLVRQLLIQYKITIVEIDEQVTADLHQQNKIYLRLLRKLKPLLTEELSKCEKEFCEGVFASLYRSFYDVCVYSSMSEVDLALNI
jgi:hypothetical protein